jgi:hypothetical protein
MLFFGGDKRVMNRWKITANNFPSMAKTFTNISKSRMNFYMNLKQEAELAGNNQEEHIILKSMMNFLKKEIKFLENQFLEIAESDDTDIEMLDTITFLIREYKIELLSCENQKYSDSFRKKS